MRILLPFILFCALIVSGSCGQKKQSQKDFDYGKINNNIYLNEFFKLEIPLPADWVVQNKDQTNQIAEKGRELIAKDDEDLKKALKASEIQTAYLLTIFRDTVGTTTEFNPSFLALTENLDKMPGAKSSSVYLDQVKKLLFQSEMGYEFSDSYGKKKIGEKEFDIMEARSNKPGYEVSQKYYCSIVNGFSLCFIISYASNDQQAEVEKIINSISIQ